MSRQLSTFVVAMALLLAGGAVWAQATINYGRITAANLVNQRTSGSGTRGAILGGTLGALATANTSGAGLAVGTAGGAIAGRSIGRRSGTRQTFEYTVQLSNGQSVRMRTDEAGLRIGDCVAVERGGFNNLRLVDDASCRPNVRPSPAEVNAAASCNAAKSQLLAATTDADFDRAERRVRLLCND